MTQRVLRVAVAAVAAATLVACGDSGDDKVLPAATSTTLDAATAAFVDDANAVCARTQTVLADLEVALQGVTDPQQVAQLLGDRLVPALQEQVTSLRAVDAPPAHAAAFDAILDEIEVRLGPIAADPVANLLQATEDPFGDLNERLGALGLTACTG